MPTKTISDGRTIQWSGLKMSFCSKCNELFSTESNFDKHLKRQPNKAAKHIHPSKAGLQQDPKGIWEMPNTREEETP